MFTLSNWTGSFPIALRSYSTAHVFPFASTADRLTDLDTLAHNRATWVRAYPCKRGATASFISPKGVFKKAQAYIDAPYTESILQIRRAGTLHLRFSHVKGTLAAVTTAPDRESQSHVPELSNRFDGILRHDNIPVVNVHEDLFVRILDVDEAKARCR